MIGRWTAIASLLLCSCGSAGYVWVKRGMTDAQQHADIGACAEGKDLNKLDAPAEEMTLYEDCMRSRGYSKKLIR